MSGQNLITAYFEADHDRLDSLFKQYRAHKRSNHPLAKNYFRTFLQGLKRHIVWEEDILFPLFEKKAGLPPTMGPTAVMRQEHREIGEALERIHNKVRQADPNSDQDEKALLDVLSAHNSKEEDILYPAIDQRLSIEECAEAFLGMENIPAERYATCCGAHAH